MISLLTPDPFRIRTTCQSKYSLVLLSCVCAVTTDGQYGLAEDEVVDEGNGREQDRGRGTAEWNGERERGRGRKSEAVACGGWFVLGRVPDYIRTNSTEMYLRLSTFECACVRPCLRVCDIVETHRARSGNRECLRA